MGVARGPVGSGVPPGKVQVNVDLYSALSWTQCAQVWYAFSRNLTVLHAHPAFIR